MNARNTESQLEQFLNHSPIAVATLDDKGQIIAANRAFHVLTQQTIENNLPLSFYDLVEEAGCKEAKLIIDKALKGDLPSENVVLNCKLNNAADIVISVYFNRIDHNGKMQLIIQCI
ncbi:MAG: PAS domain-containing protein, partial [Alphaproteobacteria bacterium]